MKGLLGKFFGGDPARKKRSVFSSPDAWGPIGFAGVANLFSGGDSVQSSSGAILNADTVMRVTAVTACVQLLTSTIASLPIHLYRMESDGSKKAVAANEHPVARMLRVAPNPEITPFELKETMIAHLELRGNAYFQVSRDTISGEPVALWPLSPDAMLVERPTKSSQVRYTYRPDGVSKIEFDAESISHVRQHASGGVLGRSTIHYAKDSIGLGYTADQYAARYFGSDSIGRILLSYPNPMTSEQTNEVKRILRDNYGGMGNAYDAAVLGYGPKVEKIGVDPKDAQYIELRQFQVSDIARLFGIPPHKIGDLSRATFSNIESQSIQFVTDAILPRVKRIEEAFTRDLLKDTGMWVEFKLDGLLRGDTTARYNAYKIGIENGFLSRNDVRRMENLPPVEGGDELQRPLNMTTVGSASDDEEA